MGGQSMYMEVAQLDLFLNVKEILVLGAYSAVVNLFESLILLSVPLALTILLPKQWFSERFISAGGVLNILLGGYFMYFSSISEAAGSFPHTPLIQAVVFFIVAIGLSILVRRVRLVSDLILSFGDRPKIFPYLMK
jgi:phosphoglycerol transferase MdoB-like AlkP superfamily enzyme